MNQYFKFNQRMKEGGLAESTAIPMKGVRITIAVDLTAEHFETPEEKCELGLF